MSVQLPYSPVPGADNPGSLAEAVQANLDALAEAIITQRSWTSGTATLTFTAAATAPPVTVTHGLAGTPTRILLADNGGPAWAFPQAFNLTATTFQIQARDVDGVARTGSNIIAWMAIL